MSVNRIPVRFLRSHVGFLLPLVLFFIAIIYINPFREVALGDDWAYARTVQHLTETGEYQLDTWLAPNMPLLAYWGAGFSKLFGYSLSTLRVSTLVFVLVALVACYGLLKTHNFTNRQSALLTLVLLVSPLILNFSFSFSAEMPYMAMLLLALLLHSEALKRKSLGFAFWGSLAAAGAILLRQFGVVLLLGWGVCWLLDSNRWRSIGFYVTGSVLPAAATLWQVYAGTVNSNATTRFTLFAQRAYLAQSPLVLGPELVWRVGISSLYLALFIAPIAILALFIYRRKGRSAIGVRRVLVALCLSSLTTLVIILVSGQRPGTSTLMPYLYWYFSASVFGQLFLSIVLFISSVVLLPLFYQRIRTFFSLAPYERLVDLVTFFSLLSILAFYKIGDRYLIVLIPFGIVAVGKAVQDQLVLHSRLLIRFCIVGFVLAALWIRTDIAYDEARWDAAESVRASGVDPNQIAAPYTWNSYYGLFDEYVASNGGELPSTFSGDFFYNWLPQQERAAKYVVTQRPDTVEGVLVNTIHYSGAFFEPLQIFVVKQDAPS